MVGRTVASIAGIAATLCVAPAQQQLPVRLDVGYTHQDDAGRLYYRLEYRKATLSRQAAPFPETPVGDAPRPRNLSGRGDDFSVLLERDQTKLDGTIFDALGLRDFRVPALRNVRLVGGLAGRFGADQRLSLGFGLESAPIHPLGVGSIPNYAMVGVLGEARYQDASKGGNQDAVSATYRVFAGVSGGWRTTYALTANWWPAPETPDHLRVQFRYENGFRRADPSRRSSGWQLTLGFAF